MINVCPRYRDDFTRVYIRLLSNNDDLQQLTHYMDLILGCKHVSRQQRYNITLCVAEAVNNIVEHGYNNNKGKPIRCIIYFFSSSIRIHLLDLAQAYQPPVNINFEIEEENGRGWYILRQLSDKIKYKRNRQINHLTIHFKLA